MLLSPRFLLSLPLIMLGFTPMANAQDANAYAVTYIEVMPAKAGEGLALVKQYGAAAAKETGNLRFDVLQRIDRPSHFAIIEVWKDAKARDAHLADADTKQFRDKLNPLLSAAYDDRPHTGMAVGPVEATIPDGAIHAVTHVDIIPPKKDDGIAALKDLSGPSRKDDGNLRYEVLQQNSRPNHFTLVEIWKDQKSLEHHESDADMRKFRDLLLPMSGSLYDQRLYKAVK